MTLVNDDYAKTATDAFNLLSPEQKFVLVQKCLNDVAAKFDEDGYVFMSLLLKEANERLTSGSGTPTD